MKSIQTKFAGIIALSLAVLALTIGACLFVVVGRLASEDSTKIITMKCQEKADNINVRLEQVSRSVDIIASFASNYVEDEKSLYDPVFIDKYVEDVCSLSEQVVSIMGASTEFYFRIAPEITGKGTTGFYRQINADGTGFVNHPITNIYAYPEGDTTSLGWYYLPKQSGKAVWLDHFYDSKSNMDMISYASPVYVGDTFVGVIGMDIDFNSIVTFTEDFNLYKNGFAILVGRKSQKVYYKQGNEKVLSDDVPDKFFSVITSMEQKDSLLEYYSELGKVKVANAFLDNDMILLVVVQTSDINADRNLLIFEGLCITLVILLITILATLATSRRITKPLRELTKAAQRYAEGDWDVEVKCDTKDEVKVLTDSVTKMAKATQSYITRVNLMAYQDSLTGLKNKASFIEYSDRVKRNDGGAWKEYAIVVFDVNYLKETNDHYGHELGDKLLTFSAHYICDVFRHSPVFRIGGDEFVALLNGSDYEKRDQLLAFFRENAKKMVVDKEKKISLSIASGMATCPEQGKIFDDLFQMADNSMYRNKQELKKIHE